MRNSSLNEFPAACGGAEALCGRLPGFEKPG
jgi:hypothetical protein